ncbi:hypothetical protein ARMGADRAFT_1071254 [Armillaria gallica]|uniref:Uncharacterized protein n=1 Tax=Armillaria gallica TaxID=47427 RepID=A0A2H3EDS9_ARMGA|nr:hypothetical protein ARMGADRAFT_1071254 [Armillaria gallica]
MNDEDIRTEFPTEFWSTLSDIFCKSVTEKIEGGTPTFTLVALAEKNIACLKKAGAIKRDIYRLSTVHEDIRPEAVLGAMIPVLLLVDMSHVRLLPPQLKMSS